MIGYDHGVIGGNPGHLGSLERIDKGEAFRLVAGRQVGGGRVVCHLSHHPTFLVAAGPRRWGSYDLYRTVAVVY